jgi:glycosyltransferase involved in cell wall biosynthesis
VKIVHQLLSGDVAGGQLVALRLAAAAQRAGHETLLVSPSDGPVLEHAAKVGIPSLVVPLGRSFRLDAALRLARVLRRERAEILHTHTHLSGNVLARVAGRLARARVVAHMHIENVFRADRLGRALQIALDDATARLCARIIAVSEATRASLARQGYPRRLLQVIHNGVEVGARAAPVRLADAPTVLHVGRLAPVKGQLELIRALEQLDGVRAVLVGRDLERGGEYQRELEREAARLGMADRVVFAGARDDVAGLMSGCEVFALPSTVEGLPLVILEAMAQERPVVATAVGGTPEVVVDGVTGLLVEPGDPRALAGALEMVLADSARAAAMGAAARRRVEERFSLEAMTQSVLHVYGEVARTMHP